MEAVTWRRLARGALTAAIVSCGCAASEEPVERARQAFDRALEEGDRVAALAALDDLREGLPRDADALLEIARRQVQAGSASDAVRELERGIRRFPGRDDLRVALARVSLVVGNPTRALEVVAEVDAASEYHAPAVATRAQARVDLAQEQAREGDAEGAITELDGLLAADPGDPIAWRALAALLVQQGRAAEARTRLVETLTDDDRPLELLPVAASVHNALGESEEAERLLRRYADLSPAAEAVVPLVSHLSDRDAVAATVAVLERALARFPDAAQLHFLHSEALLAQGRLAEAAEASARFRQRTFAGDPQLDYLRARTDLAEGDAEDAAEQLAALAPQLDRAATHFWLGRALEQSGDLVGARQRFRLAQERAPLWAAPAAALLALEARRGEWPAMARAAQQLVQQAPQNLDGWIALVDALAQLGEGGQAAQVAEQAIARFPDRPEAKLLRVKALRAEAHFDEALVALDEVELVDPRGDHSAERVLTLGMAGRLREGIALARESLAREHDSASLHAALAALLFAARIEDEGVHATNRALSLDPAEPRPLRVRCEFWTATGQWKGVREDCQRYLQARPGDAGAHFMLALALQELGEVEAAAEAYRRADELDGRDLRALNNLAGLLAASGDLEAALAAAEKAHRLDASNPHVMDTLGTLYLRKGRAERAVSLLEGAHAGLPASPEVTLHLALAYRNAGRNPEARALLTEVQSSETADGAVRSMAEDALQSLP